MLDEQSPYIRFIQNRTFQTTSDGTRGGDLAMARTGDLVSQVSAADYDGMFADISTTLESEMNFTIKRFVGLSCQKKNVFRVRE